MSGKAEDTGNWCSISMSSRSLVNEHLSLRITLFSGLRKLLTHNEEEDTTARCRSEKERDGQSSGVTLRNHSSLMYSRLEGSVQVFITQCERTEGHGLPTCF